MVEHHRIRKKLTKTNQQNNKIKDKVDSKIF